MSETNATSEWLERARQGDVGAVAEVFTLHQQRLRRMVRLRMDRRMYGRLSPSDVLQEAYLEIARCLAEYLRNPVMPLFLWMRFITARKLHALHRRHLGVHARDAGREISLHQGVFPQASSESLAAHLLGRLTSPSQAAMRAELRHHVQEVLNSMDPLDREVLALRHFEQFSNTEIAQVLGLSESAASKRFVRALKRLKEALVAAHGGLDENQQQLAD